MNTHSVHIALVGNPNSGKTSLFNALTGLNQQVGNYPGVTVDKKSGSFQLEPGLTGHLLDLPGTYSLYPRRADEWVAYRVMMGVDPEARPELILIVADASNLRRNLLFCSQIMDLKMPVVIALTMTDIARRKGVELDVPGMEREFGVPIVQVNPRKNRGLVQLKKTLIQTAQQQSPHVVMTPRRDFVPVNSLAPAAIDEVQALMPELSGYASLHYLINHESFPLEDRVQREMGSIGQRHAFNPVRAQADEIVQRYARIKTVMQQTVVEPDPLQKKLFTEKLDNILLHRVWGYIILLTVLFLLFQSIFWLAQYPMDAIDTGFTAFRSWLGAHLPFAWWSDLITNGVLAGLSGILVFVPQIMILFGLITLLEDTGYMARISFLSDKLMRKAGLNGKSVMPMISGFACAVPAIMSTRNIENRKERLLTILVTPLMSCSARLPIFTIMIALTVPGKYYFGFLSLQGLVMMALYLLGVVMALMVAWVSKFLVRIKEKSFFILELPVYRAPRWSNIGITMVEKAKIFVRDAGRVIMVISLLLWFLSSYGPSSRMGPVEKKYAALEQKEASGPQRVAIQREHRSERLSNSYAGIIGRTIEPAIRPLGFDWKIGIALVTSFAAREVFVGTMATLYSVEENDDSSLKQKMANAVRADGSPVYTLPTALSLMVFYLLAMQCMSTLAIVKRETKSWKWPLVQLAYMTSLAYLMSLLVYQLAK